MRFILSLLFVSCSLSLVAQFRGIFLEVGGRGGPGPVNYEMVEAPQKVTRVPYDVDVHTR